VNKRKVLEKMRLEVYKIRAEKKEYLKDILEVTKTYLKG
jgi:hypothetical protein